MEATEKAGDGYFRNAKGQVIKGKDGLPVEYKSLETKETENAVDNFMKQYEGFPFSQSREGMIASIKELTASGEYTLGEVLDALNEEMVSSDYYQKNLAKEYTGIEDKIDL